VTLSFKAAMLPYMYANNPLKFFLAEGLYHYPDFFSYMSPNDNAQALMASAVIPFLSNMRAPRPLLECQKYPSQVHQPRPSVAFAPVDYLIERLRSIPQTTGEAKSLASQLVKRLDNRSYGVVLKEAIDLFDLYHTLGTDVWFTDVDNPLVVVYDNFRNRKLNRLPPVHVETLAVIYNGIHGLRGWIPARGLWSLAHPDDRKGWVLTENETTASGGLRSPRVTTSYLGATFSFNADITTKFSTGFPHPPRDPFIFRADVKIIINNTINNPRVLLGRVPGLLLRLRFEWTCPSGQGGRHDYRWRSDASLPRLFGKDYRF